MATPIKLMGVVKLHLANTRILIEIPLAGKAGWKNGFDKLSIWQSMIPPFFLVKNSVTLPLYEHFLYEHTFNLGLIVTPF